MSEIAVKDRINGAVVDTDNVSADDLALAKPAKLERASLGHNAEAKDSPSSDDLHGIRSYLRLFQISRVIALLSLYLYLDQYEIHRKHNLKKLAARMQKACELTRAAVYGEKLVRVKQWFFHITMLVLRRFFIGSEAGKEANQQKQALWLKD